MSVLLYIMGMDKKILDVFDLTILTQKQVVVSGIALFFVGWMFIALSFVFISIYNKTSEKGKDTSKARFSTCEGRLSELGLEVKAGTTDIEANGQFAGADSSIRLGEMSAAALLCPGWRMKSFCMGDGCASNGKLTLVLEPVRK